MPATFTNFSRNAVPTNLLYANEWRKFADAIGTESIWTAMRKFAAIKGGALFLRADGTLFSFTKLSNGKIRQASYKEGRWGWA